MGEKYFDKAYVNRIKELKYARHCLALKVGLDKKITDQKLVMYIGTEYEELETILEELDHGIIPETVGGMITSPSNYDPTLAPTGCQSIF